MSATQISFIFFAILLFLIYYAVPQRSRWVVLLIGSYLYYLLSSVPATLFLIASTLTTFYTAKQLGRINQTNTDRAAARSKARPYLLLCLIVNFGILAVLKYTNFVLGTIASIGGTDPIRLDLILPLGISYYTFQAAGYILDVYWDRTPAEENLLHYALFVSFFPQLLQGPIGRYHTLAPQLIRGGTFSVHDFKYGLIRIAYGLFKTMVIADWAAIYRQAIFADPDGLSGIAIFGVLLYTIELYGSFSGGIDIMLGLSRMLGITMDENFRQPHFATSLSDFWQRWHITLGTWMKDYVFYPLSRSKMTRAMGNGLKKVVSKKTARTLPICLMNIIVFLLVGLWHGASWNNVLWGLYHGLIIAVSTLLTPTFDKWKSHLPKKGTSAAFHGFQIARTFALVVIGRYFDCASSFAEAGKIIRYSLTQFSPSQFLQISAGKQGTAYTPYALLTIVAGIVLLFIVGWIKERGGDIRDRLGRAPFVLQVAVYMLLLFAIPLLGPMGIARGFIYAQF